MVARARLVAADLFFTALRLPRHHPPRYRDVYTVSDRDTRCRSAAVPGSAVAGLLLKPGSSINSLRYDARSHLLRRRLHNTTNVVDGWIDHVADNYRCLEFSRFYLVESSQTLVTQLVPPRGSGWVQAERASAIRA